mmetsp:Transcript_21126/g.59074  ORF Transcript_21126/g.59074 Transcript_21126/m.59074 type:complete len:415 (+) Transcript_21126:83-1327(+)
MLCSRRPAPLAGSQPRLAASELGHVCGSGAASMWAAAGAVADGRNASGAGRICLPPSLASALLRIAWLPSSRPAAASTAPSPLDSVAMSPDMEETASAKKSFVRASPRVQTSSRSLKSHRASSMRAFRASTALSVAAQRESNASAAAQSSARACCTFCGGGSPRACLAMKSSRRLVTSLLAHMTASWVCPTCRWSSASCAARPSASLRQPAAPAETSARSFVLSTSMFSRRFFRCWPSSCSNCSRCIIKNKPLSSRDEGPLGDEPSCKDMAEGAEGFCSARAALQPTPLSCNRAVGEGPQDVPLATETPGSESVPCAASDEYAAPGEDASGGQMGTGAAKRRMDPAAVRGGGGATVSISEVPSAAFPAPMGHFDATIAIDAPAPLSPSEGGSGRGHHPAYAIGRTPTEGLCRNA